MSGREQGATPRMRSGGIDAVRIVGVLAVVAGHVWLDAGPVRDWTFPWHVPVFFFLTGYLWNGRRDLRAELRIRFRSLGVPYLVWFALVFAAFTATALATNTLNPGQEIAALYGGVEARRPFTTFWFLSALLFVALVYRLICRLPLLLQWAIGLVAVAIGTIAGDLLAHTPLSVGAVATCLVFVVAGATARRVPVARRVRVPLGAALLAGSAVLIGLGLSEPVDLKAGSLGTPGLGGLVAIAVSWGLVLVAVPLFERLPEAFSTVATALAVPALIVVLLHPVVLWVLRTPGGGRPVDSVLAVLIPTVVGLVLVRTPLAPVLIGTERVRVSAGPRIATTTR